MCCSRFLTNSGCVHKTLYLPDLSLPRFCVSTCVHYNASQIEVKSYLAAKSTVTADLRRKEKPSPGLKSLLTVTSQPYREFCWWVKRLLALCSNAIRTNIQFVIAIYFYFEQVAFSLCYVRVYHMIIQPRYQHVRALFKNLGFLRRIQCNTTAF